VPSDITADRSRSRSAPACPSKSTLHRLEPLSSVRGELGPRTSSSALAEAIDIGVKAGLPVAYVTEDTRARGPEMLAGSSAWRSNHGVSRLCLCDPSATDAGRRAQPHLFAKGLIAGSGAKVGIDWHGHNDRGLALENSLWALEFGADRVHGTALGIGERVGNAPMELILLNLKLLGLLEDQDLGHLLRIARSGRGDGCNIPHHLPAVGATPFRTATGVHAAAIIKAKRRKGRLARRPRLLGRARRPFRPRQEICIGYIRWLERDVLARGPRIEPRPALVEAILARARTRRRSEEEQVRRSSRRSRRAAPDGPAPTPTEP